MTRLDFDERGGEFQLAGFNGGDERVDERVVRPLVEAAPLCVMYPNSQADRLEI